MKKLIVCSAIVMLGCFAYTASAQVGAQSGSKKTGDPRVEKLLDEGELKYTLDEDGDFKLIYRLSDDRTQVVWILSNTWRLGTLEIRDVQSIGYRSKTPFPAEIANKLLEYNRTVKLGAWQVRKARDGYVAIFQAQIAADTEGKALSLAVEAVMRAADEMEKELTGKDDF